MFFPFVLLRLDYWNIMGISDACLERTKLNEIEQLGNKSDVWDSTCLLVECRMCRPFQPPKKEASERSLWIPYASWKTAFTYPDFMSLGVVRLGPCLRQLQISTIPAIRAICGLRRSTWCARRKNDRGGLAWVVAVPPRKWGDVGRTG